MALLTRTSHPAPKALGAGCNRRYGAARFESRWEVWAKWWAWREGTDSRTPVALMLFLAASAPQAQGSVSVAGFLGTMVNFHTPLSIRQDSYPTLDFSARYETRPFQDPPYYVFRFSFKRMSAMWELQFIHHKLYLSDPPEEIQSFEISHDFNIFSLNRSFRSRSLIWRIGIGFVLAHAESEVREQTYSSRGGIFDTGYHLTGPALIGGTGKEFPLSSRFHLIAEAQLIAARAHVPVADGTAHAPNVAFHVLLGISYHI